MEIWIDVDSCPLVTREILSRAVEQAHVPLNLVTGKNLRTPVSRYIRRVELTPGLGEPGRHIILHSQPDDLVVTANLVLATEVVARGGYVLEPRGTLIGQDNISYHRVTRELEHTPGAADAASEGLALLNQQERENFANQLDRFLRRVVA